MNANESGQFPSSEDAVPEAVEKIDGNLAINWSNGKRHLLAIRYLRRRCPCATCLEKAIGEASNSPADVSTEGGQAAPRSLPIIGAEQLQPLDIAEFQPVGNYAYRIAFSDGHGTGVYTLDYLYQLGSEADGNSNR